MRDWDDFCTVVTNRFGLSGSEMRGLFFDQQLAKGEQPWEFITRVEAERSKRQM